MWSELDNALSDFEPISSDLEDGCATNDNLELDFLGSLNRSLSNVGSSSKEVGQRRTSTRMKVKQNAGESSNNIKYLS